MGDAFVERGEAQIVRRGEIGKIKVGCLARRSDDLAIESTPVTRSEERGFVAQKFGEHHARVVHCRTKRACDAQKAQFGDWANSDGASRPPSTDAPVVFMILHKPGDKCRNVKQLSHGNSSRIASTSA